MLDHIIIMRIELRNFRKCFLILCLLLGTPNVLLATDCNSNSVDDAVDISLGTSRDCNTNSIPDECDVAPLGLTIASNFEVITKSGGSSFTITRIADFNGDTRPDILTADLEGLTISVVLNINGASFGAPIETLLGVPLGTGAIRDVEIADLDHDGDLDFLCAVEVGTSSSATSTIVLLAGRNDGVGAFTPLSIAMNNVSDLHDFSQLALGVGDLNGDNVPEIAFSNGDILHIARSSGAMPFQYTVTSFFWGNVGSFSDIIIADYNNDNFADVGMLTTTGLGFLYGDGSGNFPAGSSAAFVNGRKSSMVVGDLDNDGYINSVIADTNDSFRTVHDYVRVALSSSFVEYLPIENLSSAHPTAFVADVDFDLDPDIVIQTKNGARVLLNSALGKFPLSAKIPFPPTASSLQAVSDINSDGRVDFIAAKNGAPNAVVVAINGTSSPLISPVSVDTNENGIPDTCERATPGDFTGDGLSDYTVVRLVNGFLRWVTNLSTEVDFGVSTDFVLSADYFGEHIIVPGVVRTNGSGLTWYARHADGTVQSQTFGLAGDYPLTGYFDADKKADLVVVRKQGAYLDWYIRTSLDSQELRFRWGLAYDQPFVGDFDGDGIDELVVAGVSLTGNIVWSILNIKTGVPSVFNFGLLCDRAVPPYDMNADGKADLLVQRETDVYGHSALYTRLSDAIAFADSIGIILNPSSTPVRQFAFGTNAFNVLSATTFFLQQQVSIPSPDYAGTAFAWSALPNLSSVVTVYNGAQDSVVRTDGHLQLSNPLPCSILFSGSDGKGGFQWEPRNSRGHKPHLWIAELYRKHIRSVTLARQDASLVDSFRLVSSGHRPVYEPKNLTADEIVSAGGTPLTVRVLLKSGTTVCQQLRDPRLRVE